MLFSRILTRQLKKGPFAFMSAFRVRREKDDVQGVREPGRAAGGRLIAIGWFEMISVPQTGHPLGGPFFSHMSSVPCRYSLGESLLTDILDYHEPDRLKNEFV